MNERPRILLAADIFRDEHVRKISAAAEGWASPVTTTPDLGLLTPRELKWLAGWLRAPREWDDAQYETLWATATGKNLNAQKRQIVRTVLGGTPAGSRAALASELERS